MKNSITKEEIIKEPNELVIANGRTKENARKFLVIRSTLTAEGKLSSCFVVYQDETEIVSTWGCVLALATYNKL